MKVFLSILLILSTHLSFSQSTPEGEPAPTAQQKLDALKGTYEIRKSVREMVMLPSNLADIITANRKESEEARVRLNENVVLVIYPANAIGSKASSKKEGSHE